jgi:hypothetical protein
MRATSVFGPYVSAESFHDQWAHFARHHGGRASVAGRSVEGRPIPRYDFGPEHAPALFLTALLHGIELIGSVALLRALEHVFTSGALEHAREVRRVRLVVMPICNPDAHAENLARLSGRKIAFRRGNARGVDLNRNFPPVSNEIPWHPFAGSRRPWSPHYVGPAPLSEPESQTIVDVVDSISPIGAIGFHSFGEMLLHPWAHTRAPNPRAATYARLGSFFGRALEGLDYRVGQATSLYPTVGDLDDWLDVAHGTLAFTVEVGALDRRLLDPRRAVNPFCWMNPTTEEGIERATTGLAPAISALLVALAGGVDQEGRATQPPRPLDLAAR